MTDKIAAFIVRLEEHKVEWCLQSDRLYVLDVYTARGGERRVWQDATDWQENLMWRWLGY